MSGRFPHITFIPFEGFFEFLEENGFAVGVDTHLRVQALLNSLDPHTPSKTLKTLLCPLFAKNNKEQEKFYRLYDSYFDILEHLNPKGLTQSKEDKPQVSTKKRRSWRISKWLFQLTAGMLMVLFGYFIWDTSHALRLAPEYLQFYNLDGNFENKTKFAVRHILGIGQICDSLKVDFTYDKEEATQEGQEIVFRNLSKGVFSNYTWDFGGQGESETVNPTYTFQPGVYQVGLTMVNNQGCILSQFKNIEIGKWVGGEVIDSKIRVSFTYEIVPPGTTVLFFDSSLVSGSSVITRNWTFGDGTTSTELNPLHKFERYGEYEVGLTIESEDGNTKTHSRRLDLVDPAEASKQLPIQVKSIRKASIDELEIGLIKRFSALLRVVAMMCLGVGLLFLLLYKRNRRAASQREEQEVSPPYTHVFQLAEPISIFNQAKFQLAAKQLRRRQVGETNIIDIPATIHATLDSGGYPKVIMRPSSRPSEYLVLIDRLSFKDHQARHFENLINQLAGEDIYIDLYFFKSDFSVFWKKLDQRPVHLQDLKVAHPNHRLVIMSDGASLLDAISGENATPAFDFLQWEDRALLTPVSTADWGYREVTITRSFLVIPSSSEGLISLVEQFDKEVPRRLKEWMLNGEIAVPDLNLEEDPEVVSQKLATYLGPKGFQWLCGCALYPELQWDLTLHIGKSLSDFVNYPDQALVNEHNVLKLIRLDWFREGFIPDHYRLHLSREMEQPTEQHIRKAIIELLEDTPYPVGSYAANQKKMNLVLQKWELNETKGKERKWVKQEMEAMLEREEIEDFVVLKNLEEKNRQPVAYMLPQSWKKMVFKQGIPMLGVHNLLLLLLATPIFLFLYFYQPANPSQIVKDGKKHYYLPTAQDSAQFFNFKGVRNYENGAYVESANDFLDAKNVSSQYGDPTFYYHRGLALYKMSTTDENDSVRIVNMTLAYDNFSQAIALQPLFSAKTTPTRVSGKASEKQPIWPGPAKLSPLGNYILGIENGTAILYKDQKPAFPLNTSGTVITTQFSSDGKQIVLGYRSGKVEILELATGKLEATFPTELVHSELRFALLSPDNKHLVAASRDASSISVWDVATQTQVRELGRLHRGAIRDAAFSLDGQLLLTGAEDTTAIIWDINTGKAFSLLTGHPREVNFVAFSPLGNTVLTVANNSLVQLWSIEGEKLASHTHSGSSLTAAMFSPDGSMIWTLDEKNFVHMYSIQLTPFLSIPVEANAKPPQSPDKGVLPSFGFNLSSDIYGVRLLASSTNIDYLWQFDSYKNDSSLHPSASFNKMVVAYELKQFDQAINALTVMIGKDSLNPELYYARALNRLSHEESGKQAYWLAGLKDLKKVRDLSPQFLDSLDIQSLLSRVHVIAENRSQMNEWICLVEDDLCDLLKFDDIGLLGDGFRAVKKQNIWGYVEEKSQEIQIGFQFEIARPFKNGKAVVVSNGISQMIDKNGIVIYDALGPESNGLMAVRDVESQTWGFVDRNHSLVIKNQYTDYKNFDPFGYAIVQIKEGRTSWGVIDERGRTVVDFGADEIQPYDPSTRKFSIMKDKGVVVLVTPDIRIDQKPDEQSSAGDVPSPPSTRNQETGKLFDSIEGAEFDGLILAKKEGLFGYLSFNGKGYSVMISFQYDEALDFNKGFAPVKKRGKWGFINKKGLLVTGFIFDQLISRPKEDGVLACGREGKSSYCIDKQGNCIDFDKYYCVPDVRKKVLTPKSYTNPGRSAKQELPKSRLLKLKQAGKEFLQDRDGRLFQPGGLRERFIYRDGMARVQLDDKFGFVNQPGDLIIKAVYTSALDFSEGLAAVKKGGKWGFVDKKGKVIIPFDYDTADSFVKGTAQVSQGGSTFSIDKNGNKR